MNVLYSGDANIADGVIISTISIARQIARTAASEPLHIYILTASLEFGGVRREALGPNFAERLEKYLSRYCFDVSVTLIDISEKFSAISPSPNIGTRFTPFCMLRLYADEIESLPDRLLYLDNDVICRGDLGEFYRTEMGEAPLAGVLDYYGSHFFRQRPFRRDYLNSGVLLLNMPKIRESGLFARAREMCMTKKMFMPDQSALNKLCSDKIICPRRYNEQRRLRSDTVLQHFTTSFRLFPYFHSVTVKPWNTDAVHEVLGLHEYDDLLDEYLGVREKIKLTPKQNENNRTKGETKQ